MAILAIIVVGLKGYYYSRLFLATYFIVLYTSAITYRLALVQFLRNQMAKVSGSNFIIAGTHTTTEALGFVRLTRTGWHYAETVEAKDLRVSCR